MELDVGMHKTECAIHDMMGNVGAPFSFHHKIILTLAVVSRFISNAKLTAAMISFFSKSVTLYTHEPTQNLIGRRHTEGWTVHTAGWR